MHFKAGISGKIYALFFTGAITGVYFVGGLMLTNLQGAQDRTRKIILAVMMVASFAYFAACLMLVMISESRDSYKMLSQINQTVIEAQQKYYLLANEKEQEIKSIRHEIKNHLACINGLYHNNKLDEMNDYISQLIDQTQVLDGLLDTGNDIVNAILNDAQSRYQKDGIIIKLEGAFPKDLKIAPMDLCVIFANAVSNAVEAIQKIEYREDAGIIHIKISVFKNDLFIDIWNPVASKVEIVDGKLRTTKQDKNLHGFGTANMIQRVEKYHGTIDFENKENLFYVHINMKNE
jgi:sensor histidine kinase regulating citrate/malate metabolism